MFINFDGNIGKTAELRTTKEGLKVTDIWVAENVTVAGKEETRWHKVTFWDKAAEKLAPYLTSGRHILVYSEYAKANYYTTKDGRIVPYMDVRPTKIKFLDKKPEVAPAEAEAENVDMEADCPF